MNINNRNNNKIRATIIMIMTRIRMIITITT